MRVLRNSYVSLLAWGILLAGTSSLTSCAEDEVINNYGNKEDGAGISFSLSKDNNVWEADSRAAQPKQNFVLRSEDSADTLCVSAQTEYGISDALQADSRGALVTNKDNVLSFGVTSYFYKSTEETAVPAFYYMKNEEVEDGQTTKNKAYYWPPSNNELSFVAVAPYHALTLPDSPTASATLSYKVPTDVADHEDLMVAKTARINNGTNGAAVPLAFNHILTAVQFAIGDTPEGSITSISVSGDMIQGGTYTINSGKWTSMSTAEAATYTITGAGVTTETINEKEIVSEKIITIPQKIADNTLTLTVVFNDASAGERTLSASIPATTWAQGTTTTYTISISEAYTLEFIGQPEVQDAHYVICPIEINVSGLSGSDSWSLSATDDSGENVNWISFRRNLVGFENDHYWVDPNQCYLIKDNNKQEQLTGSNNIYNRTTTLNSQENGNIIVYAFLTENTGTISRSANINLTVGESSTTQELTQLCPSWNGSFGIERSELDYGAERYTTSPTFPWGFAWEGNSVTYHANPEWGIDQNISNYRRLKLSLLNFEGGIIQFIISLIRFLAQDIEDIAPYITPVREQVKVETENWWGGTSTETKTIYNSFTIDFSQLSDLNGKCFDTADGLQNCTDLYTFSGNALSNIENTLVNLGYTRDSNSKPVNDSSIQEYAVLQALKKNKFSVFYTPNSETGAPEAPSVKLATEDLVWFLPASGQYVSDMDSEYKLNGKYWSSTAVEQTVNANMVPYNNDTKGTIAPKARTESYQVRAARKK